MPNQRNDIAPPDAESAIRTAYRDAFGTTPNEACVAIAARSLPDLDPAQKAEVIFAVRFLVYRLIARR